MKFLRHEEFEKGCEAACNGPYDGKWSKSMVGYGPEDSHFVVELTYNYGIGSYKMGNDFMGITVQSTTIVSEALKAGYSVTEKDGMKVVNSPDGHPFKIIEEPAVGDPVKKVTLASSNLEKSVEYWSKLCGMQIFEKKESSALLGYSDTQCKLELVNIATEVDHAKAFGRIAFACPEAELAPLQGRMQAMQQAILTPLVSLDTPGKATVQVVILADPDGHEICYVGDTAFRELSQVDPNANTLLDDAISKDKSDEWFAKKGRKKEEA